MYCRKKSHKTCIVEKKFKENMYYRKKVQRKHVLQKKSSYKTCIVEKNLTQNMYCRKKFKQNMYCRKQVYSKHVLQKKKQLYSFPNSKKLMKKLQN